jgi:hypothetical protein
LPWAATTSCGVRHCKNALMLPRDRSAQRRTNSNPSIAIAPNPNTRIWPGCRKPEMGCNTPCVASCVCSRPSACLGDDTCATSTTSHWSKPFRWASARHVPRLLRKVGCRRCLALWMLLWLQAPLKPLLCAERTFWGDATVWFDFSFWFDVSYCFNVPIEASFRVAPFAASHKPFGEDRLALGLGALGEHLKLVPACHLTHSPTEAARRRDPNPVPISTRTDGEDASSPAHTASGHASHRQTARRIG